MPFQSSLLAMRAPLWSCNSRVGSASEPAMPAAGFAEVASAARRKFDLTPREAEVLGWVAQGKTNGEIANILGLASGTVKFYVERILTKLGCETRTAAAHTALETAAAG